MTAESELIDKNELIADLKKEIVILEGDVLYFQNMADKAGKTQQGLVDGYEKHMAQLNKSLSQAEGEVLGLGIVAVLEFLLILYLMAI